MFLNAVAAQPVSKGLCRDFGGEGPSVGPHAASPYCCSTAANDSVREIGLGFPGALVVMYVLIVIPLCLSLLAQGRPARRPVLLDGPCPQEAGIAPVGPHR